MLHRFVTRSLGVLAATLMLVGFSHTATASESTAGASTKAKVGCVGSSCSDQDPNAMGCGADATTPEEFTATHANSGRAVRVELRQSRTCRARWLRVTPYAGSGGCTANSKVRMQDQLENGVVLQTKSTTFGLCGGQIVTWMLGRDWHSYRVTFGYRSDPYDWDSHGTFAPSKSQLWGAW